jgi:hypothetical protein
VRFLAELLDYQPLQAWLLLLNAPVNLIYVDVPWVFDMLQRFGDQSHIFFLTPVGLPYRYCLSCQWLGSTCGLPIR